MKRALIVCDLTKATEFYRDFLTQHGFSKITVTADPSASRRLLSEETFDICVINVPIAKTNGIELAKDIAEKGTLQVILFVKSEYAEEVAEDVLPYGIFTVERPIHKQMFHYALQFAEVANERLRLTQTKVAALEKKLKEVNTISRAKCVLIEQRHFSEDEAHKYIEKQAMNAQLTRLEIAQEIIDYYNE